MMKDLRSGCTGEPFGKYFRVHAVFIKQAHELYVYASRYEVSATGVLTLFDKEDKPYRSFTARTWNEIAATSLLDGSEMYEEHDWVECNDNDDQ